MSKSFDKELEKARTDADVVMEQFVHIAICGIANDIVRRNKEDDHNWGITLDETIDGDVLKFKYKSPTHKSNLTLRMSELPASAATLSDITKIIITYRLRKDDEDMYAGKDLHDVLLDALKKSGLEFSEVEDDGEMFISCEKSADYKKVAKEYDLATGDEMELESEDEDDE